MTSNPAVERVARAICAATNGPLEGGSWALLGDKSKERIRAEARAAIAALVPQEEEVGRMVERLRNRIHDAPMETEHLLDDAADLFERLVGIQGK